MTDKNGVLKLDGQTWRSAPDTDSFLKSIKYSASKRVFGENGVNNHSSRSHHIFQIKIHGSDKLRKPRESLLNIVDLAGSERSNSKLSIS